MNSQSQQDPSSHPASSFDLQRWLWLVVEVLMIVGLFYWYGGQPGPDVNETHYLTKAKHFWNPDWCAGDLFLTSSNPHQLFYWMFGWLTLFLPLGTFAIVGRVITWTLLAVAWRGLSRRVTSTPLASVFTAAIWLLLLDRCHMAGEWVVGGFEAKGFAYAFVIWALAEMLAGRWGRVWIFCGIAAAFHVLVGGWACVCFAVVWKSSWLRTALLNRQQKAVNISSEQRLDENHGPTLHWRSLLMGGAISLLGVLPPLLSNSPEITDETIRMANDINVNRRLRHHQLFQAFSAWRVGMFSALVFTWLIGLKALAVFAPLFGASDAVGDTGSKNHWQRLNQFAIASLAICVCGILLSALSSFETARGDRAVDLLIYYWFRISDFAVPMAASFALMILLKSCWCCGAGKTFSVVVVLSLFTAFGWVCCDRWADPRPIADRRRLPEYPDRPDRTRDTYLNWKLACEWVRDSTPEDSVFITPAKQQTFKWYANRSEVVNWKDSPQDAEGLVQWLTRVQRLHRTQFNYQGGLWAYSDEQLREIADEYGATHIMTLQLDFESLPKRETEFRQVYPRDPETRSTYIVFELK